MRKKRNDFDAVGFERMTDAELSKKLGSYQRTESISISLGVILVITACISMFIQRDPFFVCALAFPGVALFLLVAKPAQTKKKALMQQQLGSFFRTELTKAFGPEPEPATLPIDRAYLAATKLSAVDFTECTVTDFHEGEYKGLRFSAANVELRRTVEEKSGPDNDNWMTRTETLFRGIVVRCKDICDPTLDIALNDMFQERKKDDITDPAAFRKHFAAHTADGREADDQVAPQLRDLVQKLEASSRTSKLCGLILHNGEMTLALNTRYVFAGVPEWLDLRDIDGIRKWFTASLTGMGNLLDLITESPALTGGTE
ncbi:hypothetical protein [Dysosmobacter sp.]|uniref:hypothetical protein n=1 Tax=Dysosmobacter sp. TaxID=2591382 RepID=UPI003AB3B6BA